MVAHDTLTACEPLLDTMASVRVRQEFSRYLHHQLETAKRLGLDDAGLPISSDPIESLFGLTKQHGVGPVKDANRMALRIPALCGLPTPEEVQQVLEITVAQQRALTEGVSSLTKQRRQMRTEPHHLEQLGNGRDQDNVELAFPGIAHHAVETRSARFRSTDSVGVLLDDPVAALFGHLPQVVELGFGVLVDGRDPHIQDGALHRGCSV